jgi:predicted DNA-binding transcriptional regulator AlpA
MQNPIKLHLQADQDDLDKNAARPFRSNRLALDRAGLRAIGIRVANSSLIRWEKAGLFPRRYRIGGCVYWDEKSVREHLARLASEAGR